MYSSRGEDEYSQVTTSATTESAAVVVIARALQTIAAKYTSWQCSRKRGQPLKKT